MKYDRESFVWRTLDGRELPLATIPDTHLANIINHVRNSGLRFDRGVLIVLLREARARKLGKDFLSRAPIPWQDVDGKWKRLNLPKKKYEVIGR